MIHIKDADLGFHPEAHALNASFRRDVPILKLSVEVNWEPGESLAALAALEARLVKLCPSLREHQCRGQEEYHVLRSTDGRGRQRKESKTTIETALALAHLYEHVMIDTIAFITDEPIVSGATAALKGSLTRFDIFVESPDAVAARLTVGLATKWMSALVAGESPDGEGPTTLALIRYLYRAQPKVVGVDEIAREIGLVSSTVGEGLDWLERNGLTRRISYTMNLSGFPYYELACADKASLVVGPEFLRVETS